MKIWVPFPEIIFRMPYLRDTRKDATRKISGHAGKNQETGKAWGNGGKKRRQEKSRKTGRTCVCVYGQVGGGGKFGKHKKFMKTGKLGGNRK